MFIVYGAAHALMIGSIVAGAVAVLWLVLRACHNYRMQANQVYARRHRRARLLVSAPSLVLVVALLLGGLAWFIGQTRISTTTVGALVDQGRTLNQAGLRTEAEVFHVTVSTVVYYRLPGDSPVVSMIDRVARYLIYDKEDVDVQVAEYGYVNFATARSATATIDRGSRTITVALPTPAVRTYIYSVGQVSISEGPLNAIGTMIRAALAALMHEPVMSTDISSELQAARSAIGGRVNPVEIFGCGKNEMEQQLAGIFDTMPQYRGWSVVAQYSGMRSVPESQCQALQSQLVHTS